jgi:hypothetical protein
MPATPASGASGCRMSSSASPQTLELDHLLDLSLFNLQFVNA